ncbi:MAG: PTS transporter subunit IIC [Chloroflexota bacterium]|jgi:PTS system galactitol-specific IIC component|nr:PTS transporter subunit IIC [Chloroflexota bacterium]
MWNTLKIFFDTFGNYITVPIIIFIISLIFKAPVKKALVSAVLVGVGLKGMAWITSAFGGVLSPLVQQIVDISGIKLPALDVGWQAVASVAYSTEIGMMFIGIGLVFQVLLYVLRWTDIFMPSDLWNNYSIIVWGSLYLQLTNNLLMALILMLFINMVTLLIAEVMQKRWSTYYKYPGTAMTAPHHMGDAPLYLALDFLLGKLGLDKVNVRPETIRRRIGFLGEPMFIGLLVGLLLGVIGNLHRLGTLDAWGQIANVAVTASAVMAIFPRIAGLFASGFTTLTDYSRKALKGSGSTKDREFIIAVNDALGYGETATLTTGLLVIPIAVLLAFILPGNLVLPVMVLPALPYMVEVPVSLSDGNIIKSVIAASLVFIAKLYMASSWAAVFTQVATNVGFQVTTGTVMIIGFIMSNPTAGIITHAFLTKNPILIGLCAILYFAAFILFKRNKPAVQEYLENNAMRYKAYINQPKPAMAEAGASDIPEATDVSEDN